MIFEVLKDVVPIPTSGILTVILLSCVLFGIQTFLSQGVFSIGACVFLNGHLHRLLTFPFYHQTFAQLLLNIVALVLLSGSLEKGFGTVRFLFWFPLLSTTTGLFYSLLDLVQGGSGQTQTEGLLPVALACVALTTMHTKMTKGFICGVSFPTVALPWVLLIVTTAVVPRSMLPCNITAILVGWVYGKGCFSFIDLSEAKAGIVEKMMPFRFLRRISGVKFIPASTEERRRTILPQISPTPGSYPVQAYAPLSSINSADTTAKSYEGWPDVTRDLSGPPTAPSLNGQGVTHSFGLSHGHYSEQHFGHSCKHSHAQQ